MEPGAFFTLRLRPMKLHFREYGSYHEQRHTLIFLHGLLGSSSNWHSIARRLEDRFHILVPDLRNHGHSPHSEKMNYPLMAEDLAELIDDHGLDSALLIGHSMGGKVAMLLALERPQLVSRLVVVDIAPVDYPNRFAAIFGALKELDTSDLQNREQADRQLAQVISEPGLRQYLLQNLQRRGASWYWRNNLEVLHREVDCLTGFPDLAAHSSYAGPVLFIYGAASDYLRPEHQPRIRTIFPHARFRRIPGAGHWVYAEQPDAFYSALNSFL